MTAVFHHGVVATVDLVAFEMTRSDGAAVTVNAHAPRSEKILESVVIFEVIMIASRVAIASS